jgi:hypothetical protein
MRIHSVSRGGLRALFRSAAGLLCGAAAILAIGCGDRRHGRSGSTLSSEAPLLKAHLA